MRKVHHIVVQWVWGYRGVSIAAAKYYAYCHDQIPPSWRTDTINNLTNVNLESITIKSDAPLFSDITNVNIELILWAAVYEKQSNRKFHLVKKEIVHGTVDLSRL